MKVFYPGSDVGYHIVGKDGVSLKPGENNVTDAIGNALVRDGICKRASVRPHYAGAEQQGDPEGPPADKRRPRRSFMSKEDN